MKKRSSKKGDAKLKTLSFAPRKGELRRIEIIEAAIECLAREGVSRFSYEHLSDITGLQRSHINYYFPSHESLIEATFKHVISYGQTATVASLAGTRKRKDHLKVYIEATLGWFKEKPTHVPIMLLFAHFSTFDPRCRDLNLMVKKAAEERLYIILRELKPRSQKTDLEAWSTSIRNLIIGEAIDYYACTPLSSHQSLVKRVYEQAKKIASLPT